MAPIHGVSQGYRPLRFSSIRNETDKEHLSNLESNHRSSALSCVFVAGNVGLFIFSILILWHTKSICSVTNLTDKLLKDTSFYSPLFDKIEINSSITVINGKIRDHESVFRQAPSAKVDAAWDHVAAEGFELIGISEEEVIKSGKDPKKCVQIPNNWNEEHFDGPQYLAQIDVFHQIHCLDMIRREAFADFYYKGLPRDESRTSHLTHCIHIILQNLMCSADVGIITHNWVHNDLYHEEPKTRPFEDFNINKKCRNFDTLLEWAELHAIKNAHMKYSHLRWEPGMQIVPGDGYGPENISNGQ